MKNFSALILCLSLYGCSKTSGGQVESYLISGNNWLSFSDDYSAVREWVFSDDGKGKVKNLALHHVIDIPKSYAQHAKFEWKVDRKNQLILRYGGAKWEEANEVIFADENRISIRNVNGVDGETTFLRNSKENGIIEGEWKLFYERKRDLPELMTELNEKYGTEETVSSSHEYPEKLLDDLINRLSSIRIEEKRQEGRVTVKETGLRIYNDGSFKYYQYQRPKDGIGGSVYNMEGTISLIPGTYTKKVESIEDRYGDVKGTSYDYNCYVMLNNNLSSSSDSPRKVAIGVSWDKRNDDNSKITKSTRICVGGLNASGNSKLGADHQDKIALIFGCYE